MNEPLRRYSLEPYSFEEVRKQGCVYVDKTQFLANFCMHRCYVPVFCRPHLLGKTLFLTTLKAYFEGKKELFKGLYIESVEEELAAQQNREPWKKYPVLHLDLSFGTYRTETGLEDVLQSKLARWEDEFGCAQRTDSINFRFIDIIRHLYRETGQRVVLLVDGADAALLDTYDMPELNDKHNRTLCGLFNITKSHDINIETCFLTGLSRIRERDIFGSFNNWCDLSFSHDFYNVCGFTEQEVRDNFPLELKALAELEHATVDETMEKLKRLYGGFNFEGQEELLNPNSVLKVFSRMDHEQHWPDEMTLKLVLPVMQRTGFFVPALEGFVTSTEILLSADNNDECVPRLFQSGFLSIKKDNIDRTQMGFDRFCTLGYTNEEMLYTLLERLAELYLPIYVPTEPLIITYSACDKLKEGNLAEALAKISEILASIPYEKLPPKRPYRCEKNQYYQTGLYLIFRRLCERFYTNTKVICEKESIDVIIERGEHVYIFAFLFLKESTPAEGLAHLKEKEYAKAFANSKLTQHLVGVAFDAKKRNIGKYVEELVDGEAKGGAKGGE